MKILKTMKEIRYIFNTAGILAFMISIIFAYLYFIEDKTKYTSEYFLITLVMMLVGELFILLAPSNYDVEKWNKEHNK